MSKVLFNFHNYSIVEAAGDDLLAPVAQKIVKLSQANTPKHISLFGGSTVFKLFTYLETSGLVSQINWDNLHLWWNDERLVDHADSESNYGELWRKHLSNYPLKEENVHPIKGLTGDQLEFSQVELEALRMEKLVNELIPANDKGIPSFDLIILGIGDDGHTASLFPTLIDPNEPQLYVPTFHPLTGQPRISQTSKLINAAKEICFVAAGKGKAKVIAQVVNHIAGLLLLANVVAQHGDKELDLVAYAAQRFGSTEVLVHIGLLNHTTMYLDPEAAVDINLAELSEAINHLN
ncbi:6-phosphogluconolactonase [Psittacicella hinzii]|uniref:6-phosphogluconolactonase n=1 Tax=Psittacicella hinzii TaxID=2028575 RepID=A0A3A1YJU2_9GAMM|nr:6-phosphogluconolactonase [Psittacicella hinzii]RIY37468.1 6-phosphogluconolactonase [Psittacicella hinzii]